MAANALDHFATRPSAIIFWPRETEIPDFVDINNWLTFDVSLLKNEMERG